MMVSLDVLSNPLIRNMFVSWPDFTLCFPLCRDSPSSASICLLSDTDMDGGGVLLTYGDVNCGGTQHLSKGNRT